MRASAYLIGVGCKPLGRLPDKSFKNLARNAYEAVLADARKVAGTRPGVAGNGGGVIAFNEAVRGVTILEGAA
jgi:hypothetical protein